MISITKLSIFQMVHGSLKLVFWGTSRVPVQWLKYGALVGTACKCRWLKARVVRQKAVAIVKQPLGQTLGKTTM